MNKILFFTLIIGILFSNFAYSADQICTFTSNAAHFANTEQSSRAFFF